MKTLFLRLNYCMLAALMCSNVVCLGADSVAPGNTSATQSTASSSPQVAPSAAELQAIDTQRAARHKESEDLAAKLIQQLNSSLAAVKAAKDKLGSQISASTVAPTNSQNSTQQVTNGTAVNSSTATQEVAPAASSVAPSATTQSGASAALAVNNVAPAVAVAAPVSASVTAPVVTTPATPAPAQAVPVSAPEASVEAAPATVAPAAS